MIRALLAATLIGFGLSACATYETGRGMAPQSIHPGDLVRQQQATTQEE